MSYDVRIVMSSFLCHKQFFLKIKAQRYVFCLKYQTLYKFATGVRQNSFLTEFTELTEFS
jgi:hypothetical protein